MEQGCNCKLNKKGRSLDKLKYKLVQKFRLRSSLSDCSCINYPSVKFSAYRPIESSDRKPIIEEKLI